MPSNAQHVPSSSDLVRSEFALRDRQLDEPSAVRRISGEKSEAIDALKRWVFHLEGTVLRVCYIEATRRLGVTQLDEAELRAKELFELLFRLSHVDMVEHVKFYGPGEIGHPESRPSAAPLAPQKLGDVEQALRLASSAVIHCPVHELEKLGERYALAPLAYRARRSYDELEAFIRRNGQVGAAAIRSAGETYAAGGASVEQLSAMLGRDVPDVVALLEEHGYRRPPNRIVLTDEAREARLRAIRQERIERQGRPHVDEEAVRRDVIASQRIEGIDARPWLRS